MAQEHEAIRQSIRTPRAAAVAGVLFALLLISSEVLVWRYVPSVSTVAPAEVARHSKTLALAMHLRAFSGIAFLWFMGVVRNRLGKLEDQFFATVFLGSGMLYVAMMFIGGVVASAAIRILASGSGVSLTSGTYDLARAEVDTITIIYATKMAGVFMISTSTIFMQTRLVPRWMAVLGYALAFVLLLSAGSVNWLASVFPLWVLIISGYVLIQDRFSAAHTAASKRTV